MSRGKLCVVSISPVMPCPPRLQALLLVAEQEAMFARIGVMKALNRNFERTLTDRKEMHWGKRKLKRDR
jgi:hypothetical protein